MYSPVSSDTTLDGLDTMRPPWADYPLFSKDASDSDSDFGSIVTHVSHAHEDEEMMILLKEQPAEMLERLRSLSAERVHRGTNEELLRVTNAFARLAERFMLIEREDASLPASRVYKRMWGEVVRLGLPEYLVGAVREDTLFDENPIWINYILILVDGTRSHIDLGSNPDAIAQYLRLFGGLCQGAYINREVFIEGNHLIDRYAPDHSQKLRLRMNKILSLSLGKPLDLLKGRRLADLEDYKCLHKLLLHNWYYRADDDGWEVHTQVTFAFATLESPNAESTTQDYHNFADEIILAIGARRFLESLSRLVRDEEIPPLILGRNLLFVKYTVPWRPFQEHYGPSGFFEAVSEAVDRYTGMGASLKNEWQVFEPVLLLLTEIIRMAPVGEGVGPLVKRFDFIDLVACTTICYAQLRTEDDTNTTCVDAMQELTLHAASATMLSDKNTFKRLSERT